MLSITLNYKDIRMVSCLNLSFEYINLFKKINVDVNTTAGCLCISGEQLDVKILLENLFERFETDNGLINMLMFMYINITQDTSAKFNDVKHINDIIIKAKKYKFNFLI